MRFVSNGVVPVFTEASTLPGALGPSSSATEKALEAVYVTLMKRLPVCGDAGRSKPVVLETLSELLFEQVRSVRAAEHSFASSGPPSSRAVPLQALSLLLESQGHAHTARADTHGGEAAQVPVLLLRGHPEHGPEQAPEDEAQGGDDARAVEQGPPRRAHNQTPTPMTERCRVDGTQVAFALIPQSAIAEESKALQKMNPPDHPRCRCWARDNWFCSSFAW
ncbi:uncharacterized protein LOC135370333 [Ornithodoros turicata]|uniref:uncharacterized protein LOC135370333 n=1 Tax=Ornithodoros turicata TaxID=34597 RepID=UPI0031389742